MEIGGQKLCSWLLRPLISQLEEIPLIPGLPSLWLLGTGQIFLISSSPPSNLAHSEADLMEDSSIISSSGPLLHFQRGKAIILSLCWEIMEVSSVQAFKPMLAHSSCPMPLHYATQLPEGKRDGSHSLWLISSMPEDPLLLTPYIDPGSLRK